jgi:hypothetical protein
MFGHTNAPLRPAARSTRWHSMIGKMKRDDCAPSAWDSRHKPLQELPSPTSQPSCCQRGPDWPLACVLEVQRPPDDLCAGKLPLNEPDTDQRTAMAPVAKPETVGAYLYGHW